MNTENIPQELKAYDQWVVWKWETRKGKPTKPLYNVVTGKNASHSDPETWGTFNRLLPPMRPLIVALMESVSSLRRKIPFVE